MPRDTQSSFQILIVDDERTFADMLAKRLALRSIHCTVAYDGSSALELLRQNRYSSVILDLRLPDISGSEVLAATQARRPGLPVIIVTGHGNDEDEAQCLRLGAVAFLHKPVDLTRLVDILRENMGGGP